MANTMESSMNVSALKLADPYVKSILDTAAHVALYSFNADSYEWEKLNVEGALFVCNRSGEPKHNLMILNRLNTYNLIEPIVDGLDLQLQDPFLLYRNMQGHINGIWFYDKDECVRIAKSVDKLVRTNPKTVSKIGSSLGSCTLVTKPPDPNIVQLPKKNDEEKIPDGTSKRVMDFFAKASSNAPSQAPVGFIGPPPGIPHKQSRHDAGNQKNDVKPLLQRLMSNPVKTVEQIEKQQRSITPHKETPGGRSKIKKEAEKQNSKVRPVSLALNTSGSLSPQAKVENGLGFLRIADTSPTINTQQFFNSTLAHSASFDHQPLEVSELEVSVTSAPAQCGLETPSKLALIPPVMFAASAKKEEEVNLSIRPEPLTKSQLLQAVTYLLKNDSDFINKLHEAYVKSFVDMVS